MWFYNILYFFQFFFYNLYYLLRYFFNLYLYFTVILISTELNKKIFKNIIQELIITLEYSKLLKTQLKSEYEISDKNDIIIRKLNTLILKVMVVTLEDLLKILDTFIIVIDTQFNSYIKLELFLILIKIVTILLGVFWTFKISFLNLLSCF